MYEPHIFFLGTEDGFLISKDILMDIKPYYRESNLDKLAGPDDLSPRVLKTFPLLKLFNKSSSKRKVQEDWDLVNVIPVFNKGVCKCSLNNRPIHFTSVLREMMGTVDGYKLKHF